MKHPFLIKSEQLKNAFTMTNARNYDTEEILTLLLETAKWLQRKGTLQWSALLDGVDSHQTAEAIQRGDVFICKKEDELAGMVMLFQRPSAWDQKLWGEKAHEDDGALYLHRLAILRKFANEQLGQAILNWCDSAIEFEGKARIRLDCIAENEHLNHFYQSNGYTYFGEKDGYSLYEKTI